MTTDLSIADLVRAKFDERKIKGSDLELHGYIDCRHPVRIIMSESNKGVVSSTTYTAVILTPDNEIIREEYSFSEQKGMRTSEGDRTIEAVFLDGVNQVETKKYKHYI